MYSSGIAESAWANAKVTPAGPRETARRVYPRCLLPCISRSKEDSASPLPETLSR